MSHMTHSSFWPECTCSWLLGYGVDEDDKERWAEKMMVWDPDCPSHPDDPMN